MATLAPPDLDRRATVEALADLVCADDELLRAEFDVLVSALHGAPPPCRPATTLSPSAPLGRGMRTRSDGRPPLPCASAVRHGIRPWERGPPTRPVVRDRVWWLRPGPPAGATLSFGEARMIDPRAARAEFGVAPDAGAAEIHRAFRRRLREHHPDLRAPEEMADAAESDQALQRILAAYAVLRAQLAGPAARVERVEHDPAAVRRPPRAESAATEDSEELRVTPVRWRPA